MVEWFLKRQKRQTDCKEVFVCRGGILHLLYNTDMLLYLYMINKNRRKRSIMDISNMSETPILIYLKKYEVFKY